MTPQLKTSFTGLGLSSPGEQKIIAPRGDRSRKRGQRRSQQVCDHPMEHCPRLQPSGRAQSRRRSGIERTVSNILAPGVHLCLPSRVLGSGCQDLTQDFFMKLLDGNLLKLADPNRGRFRSLLCTALRNFLADKQDQIGREKRGGRIHFIVWDEWMAEAPSQISVCSENISAWSPEQIFDLRWAATVVEQALRRLSEECAQHGRLRAFTVLSKCLTSEREDISYPVLATALGVSDSSIKNLLHKMRSRFRAILREEVSETVDAEASIADEIRYLCATLAAGAS